jgi:hypothetical protein
MLRCWVASPVIGPPIGIKLETARIKSPVRGEPKPVVCGVVLVGGGCLDLVLAIVVPVLVVNESLQLGER